MLPKLSDYLSKAKEVKIASDTELIVRELVACYCEEVDCWYKYFITSKFMFGAPERQALEKIFEDQGKDELEDHAVKLLNRLEQLGWVPTDFMTIDKITTCGEHHDFQTRDFTTIQLAGEMLNDECLAIEHYKRVELLTRETDPVTNTIIKEILLDEEEHKQNLINYLDDYNA